MDSMPKSKIGNHTEVDGQLGSVEKQKDRC